MKRLTISQPEAIILGLQDEIRRSPEARYDHRLHGLLLVAQGMSCQHVAHLLGDSPRTVQYWIRRFEQEGLAPLVLALGDLLVLPPNTRCRAYRWPRDRQAATVFFAVYPVVQE